MRVLALFGVALAVTTPGWHTWTSRGVSVRVPPRWHATSSRLTPVTWPVQFLAVASYPLPSGDRGADGCEPKAAVSRLPAKGALLFGWEYVGAPNATIHKADFPRRPTHFRLAHLARYECLDHSYLIRFRTAGRYFQVHILLGRRAGSHVRTLALHVLDSLVVRRR
jgi:hypothetical protein